MAVGKRKDPYRAYGFLLEIDGISRAGFSECLGLDVSADPIEYREGADRATVRKLPGLAKHVNLSLKPGITDDAQFWQWCKKAVDGQVERKNGSSARRNRRRESPMEFPRGLADQMDRSEL
jgi:phage tail-like protein